MPIYEYRCRECSKIFELLVRSAAGNGDAETQCPECGSGDLARLFSLFASRSGSSTAAGPAPARSGGGCCGGGCGCH